MKSPLSSLPSSLLQDDLLSVHAHIIWFFSSFVFGTFGVRPRGGMLVEKLDNHSDLDRVDGVLRGRNEDVTSKHHVVFRFDQVGGLEVSNSRTESHLRIVIEH